MTSNIMSLTGIAISIGVLVDGAIVEVENAYKRLEEWEADGRKGDFHEVLLRGHEGSRASGLLLAPGHRRRLPAGLHPGGSGRAAVQALGVHQEPGHGHRRRSGRHARPGPTDDVHADEDLPTSGPAGCRGSSNAVVGREGTIPRSNTRSAALFRLYEPACNFVLRHKARDRRGSAHGADDHPRLLPVGLRVHAAAVRGLAALHAHDRAGHLGGGAQQLLQTMDKH